MQASSWLSLLTRLSEQPNVERCQDAPLDVLRKEVLPSGARSCEQMSSTSCLDSASPGARRVASVLHTAFLFSSFRICSHLSGEMKKEKTHKFVNFAQIHSSSSQDSLALK